MLLGETTPKFGTVTLPDGESVTLPVAVFERKADFAVAGIRKVAGDDPDDTDGVIVLARVAWQNDPGILFVAGPGIGTVTKPGLSVPVGEAAINPVPRRMILGAIRKITDRGVTVMISIPGGEALAQKTFNPKLGVKGGLSVLGTSGRVVPYSCPAVRESLCLSVRIAAAGGVRFPVFTPGNIGSKAAIRHFRFPDDALIHVSNEWGAILEEASVHAFDGILAVGHPGKMVKLIDGHFQTHSKHSPSALPIVHRIAREASIDLPESPTVEGCINGLSKKDRFALATLLAHGVQQAIDARMQRNEETRCRSKEREQGTGTLEKAAEAQMTAVALVAMNGDLFATAGNLSPWRPAA